MALSCSLSLQSMYGGMAQVPFHWNGIWVEVCNDIGPSFLVMLMLQQGANQARIGLDNKAPMSPTWAGLVGYWSWGWSRMTKHTWLTKPWNFEHVPSNLLGRLICGSFDWGCVTKTHPKEIEAWLVCKWETYSQSAWFSYSRFLRTTRISSMVVDMIMNTMKYDTNKRWVIHNFNHQDVGNPWLFENFSFEEEG
jgi:hypothetical protein